MKKIIKIWAEVGVKSVNFLRKFAEFFVKFAKKFTLFKPFESKKFTLFSFANAPKNCTKKLALMPIVALFLAACSGTTELYNLTASQWYSHIIKALQLRDLERADELYTAMSSEHIADPLLENAQLILAQAHIDEEEYEMADFYLEENAKKFGTSKNMDFIRFLQIKAKFKTFAQPNRDQGLLLQGKDDIDAFSKTYENTKYTPLVQTMLSRFNLAIHALDGKIASLYKRTGRTQSHEIYKQRLEESDFENVPTKPAKVPWYRWIFE